MGEFILPAILAALLLLREWQTSKERERLLDRVQAPEQVVYERQLEERPDNVVSLPFDDDEAYNRLKNGD